MDSGTARTRSRSAVCLTNREWAQVSRKEDATRFERQCGVWCFILLAACGASGLRGAELPALQISDNHRYLVTEDGKPFFWIGDTAWSLFEKLNRKDADVYLEHRARNGFTVIQAVLIFEGGVKPNAYGHTGGICREPILAIIVRPPDRVDCSPGRTSLAV